MIIKVDIEKVKRDMIDCGFEFNEDFDDWSNTLIECLGDVEQALIDFFRADILRGGK